MRQDALMALFEQLLPISREAGAAIMDIYQQEDFAAQLKADASPVTAADLAAHHVLLAALTPLLPDCPVVSEEDEASLRHRLATGRFWLIDPLDGTKEFLARNGEFTVNIALIENGCPILGVVYAPAIDALYWGGKTLGAWRKANGNTVAISVAAADVCRVVASKSHLNDATRNFINSLGKHELVQAGSSLKLCRVAEGSADIYPRLAPTCEWDTAAAHAVVEGAGGLVVDTQGNTLVYGKTDVLNPSFIVTRDAGLIPA